MVTEDQRDAEELALLHDLPEIRTGDAPTPHKSPEMKAMLGAIEEEILPELAELESRCSHKVKDLVKFADTAEAIFFLTVNGLGKHASDVMHLLEGQMIERLEKSSFSSWERETLLGHYRRTKAHT
jgi:5'-deoxynucleotidase YfbR-like HD superfamily hydrolase